MRIRRNRRSGRAVRGARAAVVALLACAGTRTGRAQAVPAPSMPAAAVRAARTTEPLRLDGVPDEPAWLRADSLTSFTQRDPAEGAPASERTVVRLLATDAGLWVACWCHHRDPSRIVRAQLRRDADLDSDDAFGIVLDPQRDRRSGYVFVTNPNGALYDAEIRGPESENDDWDGVWDARARVGPEGWTAELFIPWQTLRYPRAGESWGLNVGRSIRHANEEALWRGWRRQQGFIYLEDEGELTGLGALPPRSRLELRPYLSAAAEQPNRVLLAAGGDSVVRRARGDADIGLDAKVAVAPTLTLDLTVNTDFAQVEADQQVVNLTRFPLFFPEKRPFFLEAAPIFEFGRAENTLAFYSRRIGLSSGAVVPIVGGARLTGRIGRERLGLLAVRTGGSEDATDLVVRLRHDVLSRGHVGGIATAQHAAGVERRTTGLDIELPTLVSGQNLIFAGYAMNSWDSAGAPSRSAWRVFVDYPNDWSDNFVGVSRVASGFDPALGFVREDGVVNYQGAVRFFPRPGRFGIRRLTLMPIHWDVVTHTTGGLSHASYEVVPLGIETHRGDAVSLTLSRAVDAPADDFEMFPGDSIAAGRYAWDRAELSLETSSGRPLSVDVAIEVGEFYTGHATSVGGELEFRLAPHVIAGLEYGQDAIRLPGARFTAREARLRLDYATSPRLSSTLFLQWDNESERLTANARMHWTPRPGSDAYLVWNSAWPSGRSGGVPWRRPLRGAVVAKLVWYLRR